MSQQSTSAPSTIIARHFSRKAKNYIIDRINLYNTQQLDTRKDGSTKLAKEAKPMNAQIFKNQYQMPNPLEKLDVAAQIIKADVPGKVWFTSLDLKYAFSQFT